MNVRKETISSCRIRLKFTLEPDSFKEGLDYAFKMISKDLIVPGFRKGKVPRSIYEARYGEEGLYNDAVTYCIEKAYDDYLANHKLQVYSQPVVNVDKNSVGKDLSLRFTIEVDIWPVVKLGEYKNLGIKKDAVTVSEAEIDAFIMKEAEKMAELEVVEEGTSLERGLTAIFDFTGYIDGKPFAGGKAENFELEIGSGKFIPGFEDQMVGMKANEEKRIKVTFPADYSQESLRGKPAEFDIVLHDIKRKVIPEINDDYIVNILEHKSATSVSEYRECVKEDILKKGETQADMKFMNEIYLAIKKNSDFIIPEGMIENALLNEVDNFNERAKMFGATPLQLYGYYGIKDEAEYKERIRPEVLQSITEDVLYLAIAKNEKMRVLKEDYQKFIGELAASMKTEVKDAMKKYPKELCETSILIRKARDLVRAEN